MKGAGGLRQQVRGHVVRMMPACVVAALLFAFAFLAPDPVAPHQSPLRIATHAWLGYAPLQLAQGDGRLDLSQVRLWRTTSTATGQLALRFGIVNGITTTLDEAVALQEDFPDLRIVLVLDESRGGDAIVARRDIHTVEELAGRRVAVEMQSVGLYLLGRALDLHGMTEKDVTLVSAPVEHIADTWANPDIDAVVVYEPALSHVLSRGGQSLFDSSEIPGEIMDVLLVRARVLDTHARELRGLIDAWFDSVGEIRARQPERMDEIARISAMSSDQARKGLDHIRFPTRDEVGRMLSAEDTTLRDAVDATRRHLGMGGGQEPGNGGLLDPRAAALYEVPR